MGKSLNPNHMEDLRSSGLTGESINALGFYSGTDAEVQAILGFAVGPGLIIPYPCGGGGEPFWRVKPDQPLIIDDRPAKYLSPKGSIVRAYIPLKTGEALKDPKTAVIITEGEKKAAKADQEGFPCIGLSGIWNFSQKHELIPDLVNVDWEGREVFIAPDSDYRTNPDVKLAVFTLERCLMRLGASVLMITIPATGGGPKFGLDDFLLANEPDAFRQLLQEAKPALFWEIEDITALPENKRLKPLRSLFEKLSDMDPIEISPWKNLCREKLGISTNDFKAVIKGARQEKQRKQARAKEMDIAKTEEEIQRESERESAELSPEAVDLLRDPALLYRAGQAVHQLGVAGEDENIRLIYLTIISRILDQPISITIKGESSSGKSYITERVCQLFPESAYLALTGMTRQALVYSEESFSHRTVIVFERQGMDAADYNIRTLQSEGRIIFETVVKDPKTNRHYTERIEKEGPTNFIFTTTYPELQAENATRHWSLIMDESQQQTLAAKLETAKKYTESQRWDDDSLALWRHIQFLLKPYPVHIPYARWLAEHTPNQPLRVRRDFNKLLVLIEVITILHQCQRTVENGILTARIVDYFMAKELVNSVFASSLTGLNKKVEAMVAEVRRLYQEKLDRDELNPAVRPAEIASSLVVSASSVSRWLRPAIECGLIEILSETAKGRIKSVKPCLDNGQIMAVLPSVEELAEAFPDLAKDFLAVHPVTGEELSFEDTAIAAGAEKNISA